MSRPVTHDDLPEYDLKGHVVATIPATHITRFPSLGQHLLAALAEASRIGLTLDGDDIVIDKTVDELDAHLKSRQSLWDYAQARYEKAAAGEPIESYMHYSVNQFAKDEGLPAIEWPDETPAVTR